MFFYIIFFVLVSIPILLINKKYNFFPKLLFCFICILFFSLRDFSVGSDTYLYFEIFSLSKYIGVLNSSIEPLFILFNLVVYSVNSSFNFYLFIYSTLFVLLWVISIEKNVILNKDIAFISFICFFGYLLSFNVARQALAMAICVFSLYFLFKNKNLIFFLIVGLACLIHYSAIVCMVSFFILRSSRFPFLIFLSSFIGSYLFSIIGIRFFSNFSSRYNNYNEFGGGVTGSYLILFVFLQFMLFYFIYKKYFISNATYRYFLSLFSFGVGLLLALKFLKIPDEGPGRLPFYFLVLNVFLFPYVFLIFRTQSSTILAKFIFYIFCCFYFMFGINSGAGGIKDYFIHSNFLIF